MIMAMILNLKIYMANKLVLEKYLIYLFNNLSKIDISYSEILADFMTWSDEIPKSIKIKDKK